MRTRSTAAVAAVLLACSGLVCPGANAAQAADGPPSGAVAVIGDYGSGDGSEARVADLVADARPVAIVTTGDNVYDSDDYAALVGDYYGPWVESERFFPALGNHDYAEGVDAYSAYFDYLGDLRVYTRIVDDVQYYVLDSETALASPRERAAQRAWLSRWMPRSKASWQVVVLHHPPFSSGIRHGSTPEMQWPYEDWGADLVLSGHEHQYERIVRGDLTYVVDGSGGNDLYPFGSPVAGSRVRFDRDHGALFLTATPTRLTGEFWAVDGSRVDRFAVSR